MCVFGVLQAVYSMHGATVPLYDTLGPDTVSYVINQTELTTVVVGPKVPPTPTPLCLNQLPRRRCDAPTASPVPVAVLDWAVVGYVCLLWGARNSRIWWLPPPSVRASRPPLWSPTRSTTTSDTSAAREVGPPTTTRAAWASLTLTCAWTRTVAACAALRWHVRD